MFAWFQRLGKSLLLPVAVMPVCAILMGIGYMVCPATQQGGGDATTINYFIGMFLTKAGGAILDNIGFLFAIGVAVGMAKKGNGTAAVAAIVVWLIVWVFCSEDVIKIFLGGVINLDEFPNWYLPYKAIGKNALVGIIAGLIGSGCYNKFHTVKLPDFLAFFGGKRCVAIVASMFGLIFALFMIFCWTPIFYALYTFGQWMASMGGIGVGFYMFFNRLLIPVGLHHALNNVFWFNTAGLGDLTYFWQGMQSGDPGITWDLGMYMSGFFPCMMFGVLGATAAIIFTSKRKKATFGIVGSMALCSFLCGVTEPFEFMFMFISFPLYIMYSLLYGIFGIITYYCGFRAGFSFSGGVLDLFFSSSLPAARNTWMIIPLGLGALAAFFLVFYVYIKAFKIVIPGSRDLKVNKRLEVKELKEDKVVEVDPNNEYSVMAHALLQAVGGAENVSQTEHCVTRLRLTLVDGSRVDEDKITAAGANGVIRPNDKACQIVIGPKVEFVYNEFIKFTGEDIEDFDDSEFDDDVV